MTKTIEIVVDAKGSARITTKGFAGNECLKASQFIEQALGTQVSQRTTPEFFHIPVSEAQAVNNAS